MGLCMSDQTSTNKEVKFTFRKEVHGVGQEYREKATGDEILTKLAAANPRPPQQSKSFEKGTVKVTVF